MDSDALVRHLDRQIDTALALLNARPVVTDGNKDVSDVIRGRLNAYVELRQLVLTDKLIGTPIEGRGGRH